MPFHSDRISSTMLLVQRDITFPGLACSFLGSSHLQARGGDSTQVYIPKRRTLIQVLPPLKFLCYLLMHFA